MINLKLSLANITLVVLTSIASAIAIFLLLWIAKTILFMNEKRFDFFFKKNIGDLNDKLKDNNLVIIDSKNNGDIFNFNKKVYVYDILLQEPFLSFNISKLSFNKKRFESNILKNIDYHKNNNTFSIKDILSIVTREKFHNMLKNKEQDIITDMTFRYEHKFNEDKEYEFSKKEINVFINNYLNLYDQIEVQSNKHSNIIIRNAENPLFYAKYLENIDIEDLGNCSFTSTKIYKDRFYLYYHVLYNLSGLYL